MIGRGKGAKGSSSPSRMVSDGETNPLSSTTGMGHRGAGSTHDLRRNPNPTRHGQGQGSALQPQAGRQPRASTTHTPTNVNDSGAGVIPPVLPAAPTREPQGAWSPQHPVSSSPLRIFRNQMLGIFCLGKLRWINGFCVPKDTYSEKKERLRR